MWVQTQWIKIETLPKWQERTLNQRKGRAITRDPVQWQVRGRHDDDNGANPSNAASFCRAACQSCVSCTHKRWVFQMLSHYKMACTQHPHNEFSMLSHCKRNNKSCAGHLLLQTIKATKHFFTTNVCILQNQGILCQPLKQTLQKR